MQKGQGAVAAIAVALIVGVVMVSIVAGLTTPMTTPTTVVNESLGVIGNGTTDTIANSCLTAAPTNVYDWTNGTTIDPSNYTLTPGTYPNHETNTITWSVLSAGGLHNNSVVGINYTYGCTYQDNSLIQIIVGNLPVLFGVLLLMVAVGAAMLGK